MTIIEYLTIKVTIVYTKRNTHSLWPIGQHEINIAGIRLFFSHNCSNVVVGSLMLQVRKNNSKQTHKSFETSFDFAQCVKCRSFRYQAKTHSCFIPRIISTDKTRRCKLYSQFYFVIQSSGMFFYHKSRIIKHQCICNVVLQDNRL